MNLMEYGMARGYEIGIIEGRKQGEALQLLHMIHRKLKMKKTPAKIAEELDEDMTSVAYLCRVLHFCSPDNTDTHA